jgi:hypothetical protein
MDRIGVVTGTDAKEAAVIEFAAVVHALTEMCVAVTLWRKRSPWLVLQEVQAAHALLPFRRAV